MNEFRKILSYVLVLIYVVSLSLIALARHTDYESAGSRGELSYKTHDDVAHCKHITLDHRHDCAVCQNSFTRALPTSNDAPIQIYFSIHSYVASLENKPQHLVPTFTLAERGPPDLLS